jgi:3-oxoadipate enol-lactonase
MKPDMSEGIAEVNGTRLHYEDHGSGMPLVFLHGYTLDHRMWSRQVATLAPRYRVVTYDARGFGGSALPDGTPYRHCEDAAALCEHLRLERVVAIGHSIGAHQMLEFALTRPDLVVGWVGVCTSGLASVAFPADVLELFGAVRDAANAGKLDEAKAIWSRGGWFATARETPELAEELDRMLADYSGWHFNRDSGAKSIEPPAAKRLSELGCPALAITGSRDLPYNTEVGAQLVAGIRGARALELPDAGHMAPMEAPDGVNGGIAELADAAFGR